MKALILAAGLGTRLAPITDEYPKCMTEVVNGESIIFKQIENLKLNGITDITIVCGYKSQMLIQYVRGIDQNIKFIESVDYEKTNNMYSAFLGKKEVWGSEFIMMNADVFFDECALKALIDFEAPDAVLVDIAHYYEESMKVVEANGKLVAISKTIKQNDALGSSIDVYKFSVNSGKLFFDKCDEYINKKRELKLWSEVALNDIFSDCNFRACPLIGRWYEIDSKEDLIQAIKLFGNS